MFLSIIRKIFSCFGLKHDKAVPASAEAAPKNSRKKRRRRSKQAAPAENIAKSENPPPTTPSKGGKPMRGQVQGQAKSSSKPSPEKDGIQPTVQPIGQKKQVGDWEPPAPADPEDKTLFQNFNLDRRLLKAILDDLKFTRCTPIQAKALPAILEDRDIAGKAQTGTGKTAVFLIRLIQKYLNDDTPRKLNQPLALALAPTRELALQIAEDADNLSAYTKLRTIAVFGGIDYERQRRLVQAGCDFIVATPGRLLDFLQQRAIDLSAIQLLVIDEADRMLDMGFIPDVKRIIGHCPAPADRQTLLFSATLSQYIMELASRWMRPNPEIIETEPEHVVADGIIETTYACTSEEKFPILLWTLTHEDCTRVLIFRNRRRDVEELHERLERCGIACEMLSGDVDQKKRLRILEQFKDGIVKIIVATDVAGRGIHVDNVTHVINYDFPYEAEDYVHRIGRTARAGHQGRAVNFAAEDCAFVIPDIETYIKRTLPITQPQDDMLVIPEEFKDAADQRHSHGQGGKRDFGPPRRRDEFHNSRPAGQHVKRGGFRR